MNDAHATLVSIEVTRDPEVVVMSHQNGQGFDSKGPSELNGAEVWPRWDL